MRESWYKYSLTRNIGDDLALAFPEGNIPSICETCGSYERVSMTQSNFH